MGSNNNQKWTVGEKNLKKIGSAILRSENELYKIIEWIKKGKSLIELTYGMPHILLYIYTTLIQKRVLFLKFFIVYVCITNTYLHLMFRVYFYANYYPNKILHIYAIKNEPFSE